MLRRPLEPGLARPFPKFFNAYEPAAPPLPPPGTPISVTEKWDGSLGIGYWHSDGKWKISTRGSMVSDQAREANSIWEDKYSHVVFPAGVTPLFEIVYPQWRVVVDYGNLRDLVLLAVLDIATGADLPPDRFDWPGPTAHTRHFGSLGELSNYMKQDRPDGDPEEGFVVRFDLGPDRPALRYKTKWPEYAALHRMVLGLNRRKVWAALAIRDCHSKGLPPKGIAAGLKLNPATVTATLEPGYDLRSVIPEEFHEWHDQAAQGFEQQLVHRKGFYEGLLVRVLEESAGPPGGRLFAETTGRLCAAAGANPGVVFALAYGKPTARASLWRDIEPVGEQGRGQL